MVNGTIPVTVESMSQRLAYVSYCELILISMDFPHALPPSLSHSLSHTLSLSLSSFLSLSQMVVHNGLPILSILLSASALSFLIPFAA
jgi:hypothetical protein